MRKTVCLIVALIALAAALETHARKQRTTRGGIGRRQPTETKSPAPTDTFFIPDSGAVSLYGYDKPLRSRKETLFVANNSGHDITGVAITTQYVDGKGRRFHQTKRRLRVEIPSGETRRVDYPSWDTQQSFYYVGSRRPRTSATPYEVRLSVDTVFISGGNAVK